MARIDESVGCASALCRDMTRHGELLGILLYRTCCGMQADKMLLRRKLPEDPATAENVRAQHAAWLRSHAALPPSLQDAAIALRSVGNFTAWAQVGKHKHASRPGKALERLFTPDVLVAAGAPLRQWLVPRQARCCARQRVSAHLMWPCIARLLHPVGQAAGPEAVHVVGRVIRQSTAGACSGPPQTPHCALPLSHHELRRHASSCAQRCAALLADEVLRDTLRQGPPSTACFTQPVATFAPAKAQQGDPGATAAAGASAHDTVDAGAGPSGCAADPAAGAAPASKPAVLTLDVGRGGASTVRQASARLAAAQQVAAGREAAQRAAGPEAAWPPAEQRKQLQRRRQRKEVPAQPQQHAAQDGRCQKRLRRGHTDAERAANADEHTGAKAAATGQEEAAVAADGTGIGGRAAASAEPPAAAAEPLAPPSAASADSVGATSGAEATAGLSGMPAGQSAGHSSFRARSHGDKPSSAGGPLQPPECGMRRKRQKAEHRHRDEEDEQQFESVEAMAAALEGRPLGTVPASTVDDASTHGPG